MKKTRQRGFTLIELLVYLAVMVVALGTATAAFYQCWDKSKALRRNADDIARVLNAGEQWRADLRAATGPIHQTDEDLHIPTLSGEITYAFANGELLRQAKIILPNVKSSQMQPDSDRHVAAWRWELELQSQKNARVRPLFTFETVAGVTP